MNYVSRITETELGYLRGLRGRSLLSVATDGWAAELATSHTTFRIEPLALRTPDSEHPLATVSRPRVTAQGSPGESTSLRDVARDLGPVKEVLVHSTVVTFTTPKKVRKTTVDGVVIPAGMSYEPRFRPPVVGADPDANAARVELDIAIDVRTVGHRVLVYTDGTGLFVSLWLDGQPCPGWEKRDPPTGKTVALGVSQEAER
jgi:hypothetical protein